MLLAGGSLSAEPPFLGVSQAHLGDTAEVVPHGKLQLALRQTSYGLYDRFSLQTIPLYDMLGFWNIFGKVKLFEHGIFSVSGRVGLFYMTWDVLPEINNAPLKRYFMGGTASFKLNPSLRYHFNISNTSLHGDILSKKLGIDVTHRLMNIENDIEYRLNDRRSVLVGLGYNVSSKNVTLGGSHLWRWAFLFVKLGLTFKAPARNGLGILPYFDLGILI